MTCDSTIGKFSHNNTTIYGFVLFVVTIAIDIVAIRSQSVSIVRHNIILIVMRLYAHK